MNTLRQAVHQYLIMRRDLGFKLREAGNALPDFARFMNQHRASYITQALALAWAQQPANAQPAHKTSTAMQERDRAFGIGGSLLMLSSVILVGIRG